MTYDLVGDCIKFHSNNFIEKRTERMIQKAKVERLRHLLQLNSFLSFSLPQSCYVCMHIHTFTRIRYAHAQNSTCTDFKCVVLLFQFSRCKSTIYLNNRLTTSINNLTNWVLYVCSWNFFFSLVYGIYFCVYMLYLSVWDVEEIMFSDEWKSSIMWILFQCMFF